MSAKQLHRIIVAHSPAYPKDGNPYNSLLCDAIACNNVDIREYAPRSVIKEPPEVLHFHWPENVLSAPSLPIALRRTLKLLTIVSYCKTRGSKIFWTAHNLRPHERLYPNLERWFYNQWIKRVDGIVCLTELNKTKLLERYPAIYKKPTFVIPHGHYKPILSGISKDEARRRLGLPQDAFVIGFAGGLRPYKNALGLIRAFNEMAMPDTFLTIAGNCPDPSHTNQLLSEAADSPSIRLDIRFQTDEEMEAQVMASDLTALPYTDILNSGSALYALSCSKRVFAPNIGTLPELQSHVGQEWLYLYDNAFSTHVLKAAVTWARNQISSGSPNLSFFNWEQIGTATRDAYDKVLTTNK